MLFLGKSSCEGERKREGREDVEQGGENRLEGELNAFQVLRKRSAYHHSVLEGIGVRRSSSEV